MEQLLNDISVRAREQYEKYCSQSRFDPWAIIRLRGRHNAAREQMANLWYFIESQGWMRQTFAFPAERKGADGFCRLDSQTVFINDRISLINQLVTQIHEANHVLDVNKLGMFGYLYDDKYGRYLGGEVRAETVAALVLSQLSNNEEVMSRASDYVAYQNRTRKSLYEEALLPSMYADDILTNAEIILNAIKGVRHADSVCTEKY